MSQIIPYLNLIFWAYSVAQSVSVMSQIIPYLNFGHFPWVSI